MLQESISGIILSSLFAQVTSFPGPAVDGLLIEYFLLSMNWIEEKGTVSTSAHTFLRLQERISDVSSSQKLTIVARAIQLVGHFKRSHDAG